MGIISVAHLLLLGIQLILHPKARMISPAKIKFGMKLAVAAAASLFAMSSANAYEFDLLRGSIESKNSGSTTELAFAESASDKDLQWISTIDSPKDLLATLVPGTPNQYVIDLSGFTPLPGYFLVKFGGGGFSGHDTFLFENVEEMNKLVFSAKDVNNLIGECGSKNCNISRLSHYTLFTGPGGGTGGSGGEVPEPATAALFGLGLLGVAASRRKFKSKAA